MKLRWTATLPCLFAALAAHAAPAMTVAWRDKAPYYYLNNGVGNGFMLEYGKKVFAAAGIQASFVREPPNRIWAKLQHGSPNYCTLSWYHLPARESYARYTIPVYTDPPHTILATANAAARVKSHATLAALLADTTLTLGVIKGVSYGPELDARLAQSANQVSQSTVVTTNALQMLAAGRISYMLADRLVWTHMRTELKELSTVTQYDVPDMPRGLTRHILCSRDVPATLIDRLNDAIRSTAAAAPDIR